MGRCKEARLSGLIRGRKMQRESFFYLDLLLQRAHESGPKPPKGTWVVEGFASTTMLGSDNLVITKSALTAAAPDLLKRSTVLLNHDPSNPIGKVVQSELRELENGKGDFGIWVQIFLAKSRKDIWDLVQDSILNKFSIRANIKEEVEEFEPSVGAHILKVIELELLEVSIVSVPADAGAEVTNFAVARSLNILTRALERKERGVDMTLEERQAALEKNVLEMKDSLSQILEAEKKRQEEDARIREEMEKEAEAARKAEEDKKRSEETVRAEGTAAKEGKCADASFPVNVNGKCFSSKEAADKFLKKEANVESMEKSIQEAQSQLAELQELAKKRSEAAKNGERSELPLKEEKVEDEKYTELKRQHDEAMKAIEDLKKELATPVSRAAGPSASSKPSGDNVFESEEYNKLHPEEKLTIVSRAIADRGGIHEALPPRERKLDAVSP